MDLFTADRNGEHSKGVSYKTGFFMLLGFALLGLVVAGVVGVLILMATTGGGPTAIENALRDPANAGTIRLIQVLSVGISMLLPALIVARILSRQPFALLGFNHKNLRLVGLVLLIMIVSVFVAGALGSLNKAIPVSDAWRVRFDKMELDYAQQVEMMLDLKSIGGLLLSLVLLAFIPALSEEMLFRGGLQNFLSRASRKPWLAILVISLLFSIMHFSYFGFLPRLFLGAVLGLIFYLTGNLWLSVFAHFFNNALSVIVAYAMMQRGRTMEAALKEDFSTAYWGFLAVPLLVLLFVLLKKAAQRRTLPLS